MEQTTTSHRGDPTLRPAAVGKIEITDLQHQVVCGDASLKTCEEYMSRSQGEEKSAELNPTHSERHTERLVYHVNAPAVGDGSLVTLSYHAAQQSTAQWCRLVTTNSGITAYHSGFQVLDFDLPWGAYFRETFRI